MPVDTGHTADDIDKNVLDLFSMPDSIKPQKPHQLQPVSVLEI
jgi:hypothetical protein